MEAEGSYNRSTDRGSAYVPGSRLWAEAHTGQAAGRGYTDRVQAQEYELVLPREQEPDMVCPQDPVHV